MVAPLQYWLITLAIISSIRIGVALYDGRELLRRMAMGSDKTLCEGGSYTLQCSHELPITNTPVRIFKLPEVWIPSDYNVKSYRLSNQFDPNKMTGLPSAPLLDAIEKHQIIIANGTMQPTDPGSIYAVTYRLDLSPLSRDSAGIYMCEIRYPTPNLLLRYSRLFIRTDCVVEDPTFWQSMCIGSGSVIVLLAIIVGFISWYRKMSQSAIRRIIVISKETELNFLRSTLSSNPTDTNAPDLPPRETSGLGCVPPIQPIIEPLVSFRQVQTHKGVCGLLLYTWKQLNKPRKTSRMVFGKDELDRRRLASEQQSWVDLDNQFTGKYLMTPDQYEIRREDVSIGSYIGGGAFGLVYDGEAKNLPGKFAPSMHVAIKTLRENFTESDVVDLLKEVEMMKQLHYHKHIIQLIGVCTQDGAPYLIMEHAQYGNLRNYLRTNKHLLEREPNLIGQLLHYGVQVAEGMSYLSSRSVIHRDLAARNILVGVDYVLKISDFGLTRAVDEYYRKKSHGRLPIKWMALESIIYSIYTTRSDVWSFGVLLWEIFTFGQTPFGGIELNLIPNLIRAGERNPKPPLASESIYSVMKHCWESEPSQRPSFDELVVSLASLMELEDSLLSDRRISSTESGYHSPSTRIQYMEIMSTFGSMHKDNTSC